MKRSEQDWLREWNYGWEHWIVTFKDEEGLRVPIDCWKKKRSLVVETNGFAATFKHTCVLLAFFGPVPICTSQQRLCRPVGLLGDCEKGKG